MNTPLNSCIRHSKRKILILLITQGLPLFLAQLVNIAANCFDLILISYSTRYTAFAVFRVSGNVFNMIQIGFAGILIALIPMISAAHATGKKSQLFQLVQQGTWLSLALSIPVCLMLLFPGPFILLCNQQGAVNDGVRQYLRLLALLVPPMFLFRLVSVYALATLNSGKLLAINFVSLLAKMLISLLLVLNIRSWFGASKIGCAIFAAVAAWLPLFLGLRFILKDLFHASGNQLKSWFCPQWAIHKKLLRQGVPIGITLFLNYSVTILIGLLIAKGRQTQTEAHIIASSVCYICYSLPLSVSNVATTLVSNFLGRRNTDGAANVSNVVMIFSRITAPIITLLLIIASPFITFMYTCDNATFAYAERLIILVAIYHLFSILFTSCNGVLIAYQRTVIPMLIFGASTLGIALGGGYLFNRSFSVSKTALTYWWLLIIAASVVAVALYFYQRYVIRRVKIELIPINCEKK